MADSSRSSLSERDVDQAITALKKGSCLLKYGRRGKPKFCPFHLSSDESALVWYSDKEEKQVKLNQVLRIVPGQRTAIFQRYPRPEKEYQSFSLICADRSLDLICKDKDEAEVWFVGLKTLITRGKVGRSRNFIKPETNSSESPNTTTRRVSPFVTILDQVIQPSPEIPSQSRQGKVFSDNLTPTDPTSTIQTEAVLNPFSPLSSANVETSNTRTSNTEPVRISVSSAVSTSSHEGSYQEDFDALGDIFIWGEGIKDGVLSGTKQSAGFMTEDALLPKTLESTIVLDIHNIACGRSHAALVTKQGEVFSWGDGTGGKLGHGLEEDVPQPKLLDCLKGMTVEFVGCGEFNTCAVTLSGDLYSWGHGNEGSYWCPRRVSGIFEGMHVSYVACGTLHTAVVTSSGHLYTFGDGSFGALGHGDRNSCCSPREVMKLSGSKVTRVACGVWHTAAVVETMIEGSDSEPSFSNGQLFTWGDGEKGQLGHIDSETELVPMSVDALENENIRDVACGDSLTVVVTTAGGVYTMGSEDYGQRGNPNAHGKIPARVEGDLADSNVEKIACGSNHVAVLTSKCEVYTWGKGSNGQLGHGNIKNKKEPTIVRFMKDKQVKAITCGSNFTAVVCIHKWVPGTEHSVCAGCRNLFNFRRKRHNCYNCGLVFCKVCSCWKSRKAALAPDVDKPYRVCHGCFTKLKKHVVDSCPIPTTKAKARRSTDVAERDVFASRFLTQDSRISSASVKSSPQVASETSSEESKPNFEELASLREQVEQLSSKAHQLEDELEKTRKQLKVVTAMAADEAEECKMAKEVVKSLTTQLEEMEGKVEEEGMNETKRKAKERGDRDDGQRQRHIRSMMGHDHKEPKPNKRVPNDKMERVVQDQPGVYLTLLSLPDGGNELKRVRFSRKQFTEEQAEKWWNENGADVCKRQNIVVS